MAIWQYRLILLPEEALLSKYDVLPLTIPQELAENFQWWADVQPCTRFERSIDSILQQSDAWSTSMRTWGKKHGDDAHVFYDDEQKGKVQEIAFRIDAHAVSPELVGKICEFAKQLRCVFLTADYEILVPDESMVLTAIDKSRARQYIEDPASAVSSVDQKRFEYLMKQKDRPKN